MHISLKNSDAVQGRGCKKGEGKGLEAGQAELPSSSRASRTSVLQVEGEQKARSLRGRGDTRSQGEGMEVGQPGAAELLQGQQNVGAAG